MGLNFLKTVFSRKGGQKIRQRKSVPLLQETANYRHSKTRNQMSGRLRLTSTEIRFDQSGPGTKHVVQVPLNAIQYVINPGNQLLLGILARSPQYSELFSIGQTPELCFTLNDSTRWQRTLEIMIPPQFYRCHCQAFLRQYAYITEKNHVFKVCPYCKCRVQKLEYRIRLDQTIGRWIKLPITACPSDEILPKDYRIYIVHTPLYKPYDAQRIAPPWIRVKYTTSNNS